MQETPLSDKIAAGVTDKKSDIGTTSLKNKKAKRPNEKKTNQHSEIFPSVTFSSLFLFEESTT
jgi:hypothetical protein